MREELKRREVRCEKTEVLQAEETPGTSAQEPQGGQFLVGGVANSSEPRQARFKDCPLRCTQTQRAGRNQKLEGIGNTGR